MDLISRQAAIEPKAISEWKKEFREYVDSLDITRDDWKGIIEYIDEIPSAQPEPPEDICGECDAWNKYKSEIKALPSAQPEHTETHSCENQRAETHDLVSRRAVMAKLNMLNDGALYTHADYVDAVRSVPTVEPQRVRGKWTKEEFTNTQGTSYGAYKCSLCGAFYQDIGYEWNFCPNCGADMRGKE